jgi:hypothetical protein
MRQETTAPKRSRRARIAVDFLVTVLEFVIIASSRAKTIVDSNPAIQKIDEPAGSEYFPGEHCRTGSGLEPQAGSPSGWW